MRIGAAAAQSGVSAKMVRHYERIGLLPAAGRRANAYRDYGDADIQRLRFVRRARDLGFSLGTIRHLLALWEDRRRASAEVKAVALAHVEAIEGKIAEMRALSSSLRELAEACPGSQAPDCPILEGLARR